MGGTLRTPSGPTQFSSTPTPGYGANSGMDTPERGAFIPNIPSSPFVWTPKVPKWTDEQEREGRDYVRRMGGRLIMTDEDSTVLPKGTPFTFRPKQVKETPRRRSAKAPNKGKVLGPSTGVRKGTKRPLDEDEAFVFVAEEEEPAAKRNKVRKRGRCRQTSCLLKSLCTGFQTIYMTPVLRWSTGDLGPCRKWTM